MIQIPHSCPRGRSDCIALSRIESDDKTSFICCGENDGEALLIKQDRYTLCFKGPHRDSISFHDKRDLAHQASVVVQALSVAERVHGEEGDWSPWCSDCPPVGYPTDKTRCSPCPRALKPTSGGDRERS